MKDNYAQIVRDNLDRLYRKLPEDLARNLPGRQDADRFVLNAFGETCWIEPGGISFGGKQHASVPGLLISLYALNTCSDVCVLTPFKAFREFPGSAPYAGAFKTHTEQPLTTHVPEIREALPEITEALDGGDAPDPMPGDFSFIVYPLPKIALCYIFYEADEEFTASVTCLYSNNAHLFLMVDALADVGEYTSRKILKLIE